MVDDPNAVARMMREHMGPFGADQAARSLVTTFWRMLPEGERTPERVEAEVRRLLERTLTEYQEDSCAFGFEAEGAGLATWATPATEVSQGRPRWN